MPFPSRALSKAFSGRLKHRRIRRRSLRRLSAVIAALAAGTMTAPWLVSLPAIAATSCAFAPCAQSSSPAGAKSLRWRVHLSGPHLAKIGKPAPPPRPRRLTPAERAVVAAGRKAIRTGKPAIVTSQTTATTSVVAHPNGMLSMTSNPLPVRVKLHGAWAAINPSLRRTGTGTWAPVASPEPVAFSGGGTGALVTITDPASGQHLSLSWPNPLPRPVISGRSRCTGRCYRALTCGSRPPTRATRRRWSCATLPRPPTRDCGRSRSASTSAAACPCDAVQGLARCDQRHHREGRLHRGPAADVGLKRDPAL